MIFSTIIQQLIEILEEAHHKNVILDDIHPDNFLIDKANKIHFIDLEFAHKFDESRKVTAKTEGFYLKSWIKIDGNEKRPKKSWSVDFISSWSIKCVQSARKKP